MKVKTFLASLVIIIIVGLSVSIGLTLINADTDTDNIDVIGYFNERIKVIFIRQYPQSDLFDDIPDGVFILVYEEYFPECACYEETTILVNPLSYKLRFDNLKTPSIISISGRIVNDIYNIDWMNE